MRANSNPHLSPKSFTTKELIATNITAHRVTADELCAKDETGVPVCVTGIQLRSLLSGSVLGASAANDNDPPAGAEPAAVEPTDAIDPTASSTPPLAADAETSSPANDNDPPPEAEPDEPANAIEATASSTPPVAADAETSSPANDNEAPTLPATEPSSAAQ